MNRSNINLNTETQNYLDAVVNPLNHDMPVRVPDGFDLPTMPLIDYLAQANAATTIFNVGAPTDAIGAFFYIPIATSKSFYGVSNAQTYSMVICPVTAAGAAIADSGNMPSATFANYATILSLSKSFRLIAGGFRLLPKVELVTNTGAQYIVKYYAACLETADINRWFTGVVSLLSLFEATRDFKDFSNADGVCLRYDPFQYLQKQLEFYTSPEWLDTDIVNNDKWLWSCAYVEFLTPIAAVSTGVNAWTYTFPVKLYAKLWLEAQLIQPTPLLPTIGPFDLNFGMLRDDVKRSKDIYPCICEGHTFLSFLQNIRPLAGVASGVLRAASFIHPLAGQVANLIDVGSSLIPNNSEQKTQPSVDTLNRAKNVMPPKKINNNVNKPKKRRKKGRRGN